MFRVRECAIVLLVACGKPATFQGETTLTITGTPPAPPPVATPEPPRVEVRDNKIAINEKIQFAYDKADILPVSFDLLNEVVAVIKKNPHIKRIRIEGHASADGEINHNRTLSEARARSVQAYLINKGGIAKQMLIAQGFGIDKPIADNATKEGREQNRRVEFNIIEQEVTMRKLEIDKGGKEKVVEERKQTVKAGDTSAAASK